MSKYMKSGLSWTVVSLSNIITSIDGRWLETTQAILREVPGTGEVVRAWASSHTWWDKDSVWQYGNSGSCTGYIADRPGAFVETIRYSDDNPNIKFPYYLDHVEIHRVEYCEDPHPLKIPIDSKATFLELNSGLIDQSSSPFSQPQTSISSQSQNGEDSDSRYNSPVGGMVGDASEMLTSPDSLKNEIGLSRVDEVQGESDSEIVENDNGIGSESSSAEYDSAPGRLETLAPQVAKDTFTWDLWPTLQIAAPASMRFVTDYHNKHPLPKWYSG